MGLENVHACCAQDESDFDENPFIVLTLTCLKGGTGYHCCTMSCCCPIIIGLCLVAILTGPAADPAYEVEANSTEWKGTLADAVNQVSGVDIFFAVVAVLGDVYAHYELDNWARSDNSCIGLSNCTNRIWLRAFMLWATVVQVALNIVKSTRPDVFGGVTLEMCIGSDKKSDEDFGVFGDEKTVNCAKVSHVALVTIIVFPFASAIKHFEGCMIDDMKASPQQLVFALLQTVFGLLYVIIIVATYDTGAFPFFVPVAIILECFLLLKDLVFIMAAIKKAKVYPAEYLQRQVCGTLMSRRMCCACASASVCGLLLLCVIFIVIFIAVG
jgi:hypothetical protein